MSKASDKIQAFVKGAIEQGLFPGLEVLVSNQGKILFNQAYGHLSGDAQSPPLKRGMLFDLASLTKPLASTVVTLRLVEEGKLFLEAPLYQVLRELDRPETREITFKDLLTHRSGLPAWEDYFSPSFDRQKGLAKLLAVKPSYERGTEVVYSCVNYLLLGQAIRRITARSLYDIFEEDVLLSKERKSLTFFPKPEHCVPTAFCPFRKLPLQGQVHDENAALFAKDAGNSGLFGSAEGVHEYLMRLIDPKNSPLSAAAIELMLADHNPAELPPRALGWDMKHSEGYMSAGDFMPDGSLGHLGFTGTSLWFEPKSQLTVILLSNRVNLSREENQAMMRDFRPRMHNLLLSTLL